MASPEASRLRLFGASSGSCGPRSRAARAVHPPPLPGPCILSPGDEGVAEAGAGGRCDLPARRAGAFHVPCVSQSPAGPRVRGWAARGSGNGEGGKRCPLWVGPAPSSRLAAFGLPSRGVGGFHAGPLRLTLRFLPPGARPLCFSGCLGPRPRRPAPGPAFRSPPPLPLLELLVSQSRSSHNRPALFPFPYFFLCLAPTCFGCSPPSSGSLPSAFSGCKQQLLHLGVPPPRALNVTEAVHPAHPTSSSPEAPWL